MWAQRKQQLRYRKLYRFPYCYFKIQKKDGQIIAGNKTVNQGSKAINVADRIVTDGKVIITSSAPGIVQVSGNKFIPEKSGKSNADNSCESRKELQGCCGEKDYSYGTPS